MRGRISPKTSNASFWIGPKGWRGERNVLNRLAPFSISRGAKIRSTVRHPCRRPARTGSNRVGASCARGASAKGIFGAGDEDAGAARLAPDALVARSRRTVVVVARDELALVDPQLTVEEMQLFYVHHEYALDNSRQARGVPAC